MIPSARFLSPPASVRPPPGTCAVAYVRWLVQLLVQDGHDGWAMAARAGIAQAQDWPDGARVATAPVMALWRAARAASGDEALGLSLAARMGPESLALLGQSAMLGQTLGEAYRRVARDLHWLGDWFDLAVKASGPAVWLTLTHAGGAEEATPECRDAGLAALLVVGRRLCADPALVPLAVDMRRPAPADLQPFAALFGCVPTFGAAHDRLAMRPDDMARPLFSAHPGWAALFDRELGLHAPPDLGARVREQLAAHLPAGVPSAAALARSLHLSPRSLHRRLAREGRTYRALLELTRRELALTYLLRSDLPLGEIAGLLGFAEQASFSRACRRWYGRPASSLRAQGAGALITFVE